MILNENAFRSYPAVSLKEITNVLVFIAEMESVYCAVRTVYIYVYIYMDCV